MVTLSHTSQAALKEKLQNVEIIETYAYFPEVIGIEKSRLEVEEFYFLLSHDYIKKCRTDCCGKIYQITEKGNLFILNKL